MRFSSNADNNEFGNHYTCKFLFLYAQGPRASLDWIYKSVCYRTGMLPFDPLRGPVCNAAASSIPVLQLGFEKGRADLC